jgi:hypothetical protein
MVAESHLPIADASVRIALTLGDAAAPAHMFCKPPVCTSCRKRGPVTQCAATGKTGPGRVARVLRIIKSRGGRPTLPTY